MYVQHKYTCPPMTDCLTPACCLLTRPLDVHAVLISHLQSVWNEVVLHGRESLHDVASLAPHVEVVQATAAVLFSEQAPRAQADHVRPVLEGATKLSSVDGQTEWLVVTESDVHVGVLFNRRTLVPGREKGKVMDTSFKNFFSHRHSLLYLLDLQVLVVRIIRLPWMIVIRRDIVPSQENKNK